MKKLIYLIMAVVLFNVAAALEYHSDRLNIPVPGTNHTQTITGNPGSNVTVTIPAGWVIMAYSPSGIVGISDITFNNLNSSVYYTIESPAGQQEGTTFVSEVYENNIKQGQFLFVAVPDDKILNCKSELGHGESNWLDTAYLPTTDISLFNMVRVFPLGSYYNEDARNASVRCVFPKYHILVSQGTQGSSFDHNLNNVTANLYWENLGKNWFRVAPVEQEITGQSEGDIYAVTCDTLTYEYSHGTIVANNPECIEYEFRDPIALNLSAIKPCSDLVTISCGNFSGIGNSCSNLQCVDGSYMFEVSNIQEYTVYDVEFKWTVGSGDVVTRTIREIGSGETLVFYVGVEGTGTIQMDVSYVPEWYKNALAPHYQVQSVSSLFFIDNSTARMGDATLTRMLQGNNVIMSDNDEILIGEKYKARVYVSNFFGNPIDADTTPKIKMIDPLGNVELSPTLMTKEGTGSYWFEFTTTDSMINGVWEAITMIPVNGELIERNDYWELEGNPAQVQIRAVDTSVPSIVCRITIQNEGMSAQEYNFKYWVTPDANGQWGENSSIGSGSAAKLLTPSEVYVTDKTFTVPNPGEYWCKVLVYWDGEASAASDKFTATRTMGAITPPETCFNGIDDDRDGYIDSLDPQCASSTSEGGTVFSFLDFRERGPWILLVLLLLLLLFLGSRKKRERRGNYIDIPYR